MNQAHTQSDTHTRASQRNSIKKRDLQPTIMLAAFKYEEEIQQIGTEIRNHKSPYAGIEKMSRTQCLIHPFDMNSQKPNHEIIRLQCRKHQPGKQKERNEIHNRGDASAYGVAYKLHP